MSLASSGASVSPVSAAASMPVSYGTPSVRATSPSSVASISTRAVMRSDEPSEPAMRRCHTPSRRTGSATEAR